MGTPDLISLLALALVLARWAAELGLAWLNQRHVRAHASEVPAAFRDFIDPATYAKSVEYTLAKSRFGQVEGTWDTAILIAVLFSGVLPAAFDRFAGWAGASAWGMAAFLVLVGVALALTGMPFHWYAQFRLEDRFGFNTATPRVWWMDRVKGFLLSLLLGYPLLVLILKLVGWAGAWWWLWAWGCVIAFQLVLHVLGPVLIMPLFNKFTPLPEGTLRDRLLALARRASFRARSIQVMDGSKRSRHSNAFFAGVGRFRKIVLFDTLIQQLSEPELEATLAHEIGHWRLRHIPKIVAWSAASLLAGFYAVAWLAGQEWLYRAFGFGFAEGRIVPALLLFALVSGTLAFWFSPLIYSRLRRYEYQADAFAAATMGEPDSMIGALRKLFAKNLSNLTPHPLYSRFYYSHPTLAEREAALEKQRGSHTEAPSRPSAATKLHAPNPNPQTNSNAEISNAKLPAERSRG